MQVELKKENGCEFLIIKLPVSKRSSATGKTTIVASTNGNQPSPVQVDGKPVIVGVNCYIK